MLQKSVIPFYKDYIGTTQSIASVAIKARVEGFLLEKHFTEGTLVKKNQLLYVIDKRPFEAAEINLSYCSMFSLFEGLIGRRYVDLGNLVGCGTETLLVNVLQLDPMYVQFSPSVEDFRVFLKYQGKHPFKVEAWLDDRKKCSLRGRWI